MRVAVIGFSHNLCIIFEASHMRHNQRAKNNLASSNLQSAGINALYQIGKYHEFSENFSF